MSGSPLAAEFIRARKARLVQSIAGFSGERESQVARVVASLAQLADQHRLVLLPDTDMVWMAHPFSAIATDFVVYAAGQQWYANCVWDGLSILGMVGDGRLE